MKNISLRILRAGIIGAVFLSGTSALAYVPYTWTNAPAPATTTIPKPKPLPTCLVQKTTAAPNEKIIFTPVAPTSTSAFKFMWKGETSTTTVGKVALAFIYPGNYTVILRAIGFDGSYTEAPCPTISVGFDTVATSVTSLPAAYVFPFATSTTKALIPKEYTPLSKDCFNLETDLSFGYSDDVSVPSDGVIYKLQQFLSREGYLKSEPTGYFGSLTLSAVKAYQTYHALPSTGYVGPMTRGAMKNQSCLG